MLLQIIEKILQAHQILAFVLGVGSLVWFVGKRGKRYRNLSKSSPVFTGVVDLFFVSLSVILVFVFFRYSLSDYLDPEDHEWLNEVFNFCLAIAVSFGSAKIINAVIAQKSGSQRRKHPRQIPGLLRSLIYGSSLLAGIAAFMFFQGYSLTGIWISTGLFTAMIGFALQQTLGDFFSGLALSIENSFRIGDWLILNNDLEGEVVDLNWRATILRGWDNAIQVVPNSKLASQGFKNLHGKHHPYRPWYYLKIPSEVDPRFAKELLYEAIFKCKNILKEPHPVVRLKDASTLPYTYMVWVAYPNYISMFMGREELFREIHYILASAGISPAPEIGEWRTRRTEIPTAEPPTIRIALRSLEIFQSLEDEEIEVLALSSDQLRYDAGSTISLEGDERDALDIVVSGIVESQVETSSGQWIKTAEFTAGQDYGLVSMFVDRPSIFKYVADTDVTLIRVDFECIKDVLKKYPEMSDRYARVIKQRLDEAELIRTPYDQWEQAPATLQQIKRLIRQFVKSGKT